MALLQFIGGGALLLLMVLAARRSVRRQPPSPFDLGVVSDHWMAQMRVNRDDPARD